MYCKLAKIVQSSVSKGTNEMNEATNIFALIRIKIFLKIKKIHKITK